jgi:oxygen-independent coproporphyrinogen-3 oxidase
MGYTTTNTKMLLGLGVSAISDAWTGFSQNVKDVESYISLLTNNQLPLLKGHILTSEDLTMRQQILNIMCRFATHWQTDDFDEQERAILYQTLNGFQQDGLIFFDHNSLLVLPLGRPFIRNICMAFDKRMLRQQTEKPLFSQTI